VLQEDLEKFLSAGPGISLSGPAKISVTTREDRTPFKGLRKKIAEKMRLSKDKAAHFTYVEEADVTELVKLRTAAKAIAEGQGIKLTYLPIVMKAMVAALKKHPNLNSTLDEAAQEIVVKHYYNIGLSVQTADGLTAPVIKNVESKSILQIAKEIQEVVAKARAKKLTMEDLTGGTITLTNAGSIGGLFATPVINFPEVAIVGFNKISRKPVVKTINGVEEIVIRDWTYFSISLDHRIVDGAIAAEFMKEMIRFIENPALMFLEG
jgi:pyruvate dehydrogenase E2 component (dihydrolipoamide acetyltransferase)